MLYEAPLVAFTVLAQTAVGAHLTVNAFEKFGLPPRIPEPRMNIARFAILVVMGLGFMFSTTHLGSPLRAFNAFNRIGNAALSNEILIGASFLSLAGLYWLLRAFNAFNRIGNAALSNEILIGASFLSLAGLYWLMTILKIGSEGLRKVVNWLSIAVSVIFMFAMANVYQIETVPAWYTPMTTIAFGFTVVTAGLMFGYMLINVLDVTTEKTSRRLMWVGVSLITLNLAFTAMQTIHFASISTAIHSGLDQMTLLSNYVAGHVLLLVISAGILVFTELFTARGRQKNLLIIVAFVALFVAEILGRNVFYGMHFTSGLY
ncbi:dimethyl sulfoxide reductase anchor subunit [Vibrio natriegens]|uniref:dimethyl sulfoxide reductase anchor subunit family protein n=1 Tax=Vibrio natriegens TaxID=691 RepID=UPI001EFD083A|nr:DmsC/YnfH family molybdoenzyme membrane anchor subunit [Vibrio natriegens]MCG9702700.1 dimethyl sulfoxide reductase anchor subunit [Vibrio natriegens]